MSRSGIAYYLSGEVTDWPSLAHRRPADLESSGLNLRLETVARRVNVTARKLLVSDRNGADELISYDSVVLCTGAVPIRPDIAGLDVRGEDVLGPDDGLHVLNSMDEMFEVLHTLGMAATAAAVIVGGGYLGVAMAAALVTRGLSVTHMDERPEVMPGVDRSLAALVRAELVGHGVEVLTRTSVYEVRRAAPWEPSRLAADDLHQQFRGIFSYETILELLLSSYQDLAVTATIPDWLAIGAERFARQRLQALARADALAPGRPPAVLFLCTRNAGRSQIALGWLRYLAGSRAMAWAAGSSPAVAVDAAVRAAMSEAGIDIGPEFPKPVGCGTGARRRRSGHHGMRRRLPAAAGQALRGLGGP